MLDNIVLATMTSDLIAGFGASDDETSVRIQQLSWVALRIASTKLVAATVDVEDCTVTDIVDQSGQDMDVRTGGFALDPNHLLRLAFFE